MSLKSVIILRLHLVLAFFSWLPLLGVTINGFWAFGRGQTNDDSSLASSGQNIIRKKKCIPIGKKYLTTKIRYYLPLEPSIPVQHVQCQVMPSQEGDAFFQSTHTATVKKTVKLS